MTPAEKLAASLEELHKLQAQGRTAIRAEELTRVHRERLLRTGFLKAVINGWYIPSHPGERDGETTIWYSSFWQFCAAYCNYRFDYEWCLSPEQSLLIHAGNFIVPRQLMIRSPRGANRVTELLFDSSIIDMVGAIPNKDNMISIQGLNIYSIASGLINCSAKFFTQHPVEARTLLFTINDASEILGLLLEGGHSTIAGRLIGAFRNIGNIDIANNIAKKMKYAGYDVREIDPFNDQLSHTLSTRERSPYANRLRIMWQDMRKDVIKFFSKIKVSEITKDKYLADIDDKYVLDAYHSLSIEGYQVSKELIERVRSGKWNPDHNLFDNDLKNALAARGYWLAFQAVKSSVKKVLSGKNPGSVIQIDHHDWYQALFGPSITAGILQPADLAGYRRTQVYIRTSKHVPPSVDAVRDLMPVFFDLLSKESDAWTRIILGHFFFVYIHPYMDGNGRMGRFIMNTMFAAKRYPWLIIPVEKRTPYFAALEAASTKNDIIPFCKFIASLAKIKH